MATISTLYLTLVFAIFSNLDQSIECARIDLKTISNNNVNRNLSSIAHRAKLYQPIIVEGERAGNGEALFIVQVRQLDSFCGGSFVSPNVVLTAAHCVDVHRNVDSISIRYGTRNLEKSDYTDLKVKKAIRHQNYNKRNGQHDIAILVLVEGVKRSQNVQFAKLNQGPDPEAGSKVIIYGWGQISSAGRLSPYLQKLTLTTLSLEQCRKTNEPDVICGKSPVGTACQGDSGGPMVNSQGVLVGVASRVRAGCLQRGSNIYTSVSFYYDFITKYM